MKNNKNVQSIKMVRPRQKKTVRPRQKKLLEIIHNIHKLFIGVSVLPATKKSYYRGIVFTWDVKYIKAFQLFS